MDFNEEYLKLPEIYTRSGKKCYLDPIRNKLIYVTPEETVRQRVIQFLIENKFPSKYPEGILYWTKKNICEYNNNGWCELKDTGEYGYLCKDQECIYKGTNND